MALEPPGTGPPGGGGFHLDSKWLIAGVVTLAVLAYYIWTKQSQSKAANQQAQLNGPSALNVNAELAPISTLDQFPQNQLVGMNELALPGVQSNDINAQLQFAQSAQQTVLNQ